MIIITGVSKIGGSYSKEGELDRFSGKEGLKVPGLFQVGEAF